MAHRFANFHSDSCAHVNPQQASVLHPCPLQMAGGSGGYTHLAAGLSDSARRQLVVWLGGGSAWVFSMVVLGGMTRLTRSGLSMTDWKFTGKHKVHLPAVHWSVVFQGDD
jgi:hypothetical protein